MKILVNSLSIFFIFLIAACKESKLNLDIKNIVYYKPADNIGNHIQFRTILKNTYKESVTVFVQHPSFRNHSLEYLNRHNGTFFLYNNNLSDSIRLYVLGYDNELMNIGPNQELILSLILMEEDLDKYFIELCGEKPSIECQENVLIFSQICYIDDNLNSVFHEISLDEIHYIDNLQGK